MYKIAKLPIEERNILFQNSAMKAGINAALIEKDFWVCLTLDYLFHKSPWKDKLIFKGGTSLSKVYHLINRFSEDIDLILDWRVLGYRTMEPWEDRSNTKQQKFIDDSRIRLFEFLKNDFMPTFQSEMSELIGSDINVFIAEEDPGTVNFVYPSSYRSTSLLREIRLEIGALATWTPAKMAVILPYAATYYPDIFEKPSTEILTTTAERAFWEKATILHQEAFRPENSLVPLRYARHYYDVYCMANSPLKESALQKPELLMDVAAFKQKFYPRKWARYDLARFGTLKLLPAEHSIKRLRDDYHNMADMFYGNIPTFNEILKCLSELEIEINSKG